MPATEPTATPSRRMRGFIAVGTIVVITIAMGVAAAVAAAWIYFHPHYE